MAESGLELDATVAVKTTAANAVSLWSNTEEEDCCRVCHGAAEESRPLFHPCRCSGSIKFVHQDCLQTWLKVSNKSHPKCELCGEQFSFRSIYTTGGEGKPPKLTSLEFATAILSLIVLFLFEIGKIALTYGVWTIGCPIFMDWWAAVAGYAVYGEEKKWLLMNSYQTKNFVGFATDFGTCW